MNEQKRNDDEKLVHGYERMLERVKEFMEKAVEEEAPRLRQAIEHARDKAVELGELTREEAEKLAEYLRRDIEDAAAYLSSEQAQELKEWLRFDIKLIEERLADMFLSVADKATVEFLKFREQLQSTVRYHTGEITGPGTLECVSCGEHLHFHRPSRIRGVRLLPDAFQLRIAELRLRHLEQLLLLEADMLAKQAGELAQRLPPIQSPGQLQHSGVFAERTLHQRALPVSFQCGQQKLLFLDEMGLQLVTAERLDRLQRRHIGPVGLTRPFHLASHHQRTMVIAGERTQAGISFHGKIR